MRESVIVFYANCKSSKKLGDFAACGSIAYCIGKKTDLPIVLLSDDDGIGRFDVLYSTSSGHHVYDMPVRIYSTRTFPSNDFTIAAHIAIGCKYSEIVQNKNYPKNSSNLIPDMD